MMPDGIATVAMTTAAVVSFAPVPVNVSSNFAVLSNANDSGSIALDAKAFIEKEELFNRLNQIASLDDDWNGYGAHSFSAGVIDNARMIVSYLPKQPELFPTGRGTVQMEYRKKDGTYLEFEVFDNRVTVLFVDKGNFDTAIENELKPDSYTEMFKYVKELG